MKIITRGEAMRIHQQHPTSRLFPFCTGKYRWHGSAEAYTGREVQDIPGVLAVFAERRKDSFGPYVRLMSVTYALVRTDQPGFSACTRSQLINSIDILRARRATGLMTRDNYRTVNNITLGKYPEAK